MRNIGFFLILVFIGMTILVVSSRKDSVQVSRAQIITANQSYDASVRTRRQVEKKPAKLSSYNVAEPIGEIDPEPPVEPDEFSPPEDSNESKFDKVDTKRDEDPIAREYERLIIPTLKVNGKVVLKSYSELSWDLTTLGQDIAVLDDIPGQSTENNIIFAGHVTVRNGSNGPFRSLWKLNPGEKIILHDDQFVYTYIVRDQVLVYPEDSSVLADTSHPQLTLITCHTWDEETLSYLRRLVVSADLHTVEPRHVSIKQ
jgi:LPXTG-site transpeptidase (sortase) family protein